MTSKTPAANASVRVQSVSKTSPFLVLRIATSPAIAIITLLFAALVLALSASERVYVFQPYSAPSLLVCLIIGIVYACFQIVYALFMLPPSLFVPSNPKRAMANVALSMSAPDGAAAVTILAENLKRRSYRLLREEYALKRFTFAKGFPGAVAKLITAVGALIALCALIAAFNTLHAKIVIKDGERTNSGYDKEGTPIALPFSFAYHGSAVERRTLTHSIAINRGAADETRRINAGDALALDDGITIYFAPPLIETITLEAKFYVKLPNGYMTIGQTPLTMAERVNMPVLPFALYPTGLYENFYLDSNNEPHSKGYAFVNPAVRLDAASNGVYRGSAYLRKKAGIAPLFDTPYYAELSEAKREQTLIAVVKYVPSFPYFILGVCVFLLGFALLFLAPQSIVFVSYIPDRANVIFDIFGYAYSTKDSLIYAIEAIEEWAGKL